MLLGQADLFKKVSKLELKELKGSKFYPAFLSKLEALLLDVYASLLPTASDYEQRKQLIQAYNMIVRSIFGNTGGFPVVEAFGSFVMDIFTAQSDLDLSINFNNTNASCFPRDQVVIVLRRLAKVLYKKQSKGHLSGVVPVLHARVPVLKAVDCNTGIECDISVENKDGISRSLFFSIISSIDERFRIISYLMKAWAKANDINSSKDLTMNSLSIISLVAFHFQTRDPPILPPFSKLLRDGTDITNICNVVLAFKNFGVRNKESVAELFVALLAKLSSVEKLWELGLCASIFEGSWISKTWGSKVGNMSIEDFLDRSQNFARSVGKIQMTKINACLQGTLDHLSHSMQDQTELSVLRSALFGPISFDPPQTNRIESIAAKIIKQKLPIQSVHPIIDIGDKGNNNHAKRRKQTRSDSAQPHAYTLPTNHSSRSTATTLNQKLPSNEPVDPLIDAITHTNQASSSSTKILKQKLPSIESRQPHIRRITQKRTRYAEAPSFGAHQNQSTSYLYPALPYVSPQPINLIGHPHVSFDPSGHPSHGYPKQPIYANSGHGPRQNHLIYASQLHPMVPVRPAYGSQGPLYYPNPVLPIFPGQTVPNTRNPRHFVPSRWFGSDHL